MPDIFFLVSKWWKQMLIITILPVIIVGVVVFLLPRKYLAVTTALPASANLTDKSRIFNSNIEYLYSTMGNTDDLDKIIGTAQLDTLYLAIADEFNLWDHYGLTEGKEPLRYRAAELLKKNSRVIKSEYGELKVKVWNTDEKLAPQLANALTGKLNSIHQNLQNESNIFTVNSLKAGKELLRKKLDSAFNKTVPETELLSGEIQQFEKLISEYQLMVDSRPSVLITVEAARVSYRPDKPKRMMILTATALLSLLFSFLLVLILERRVKTVQ